MNKYIPIIIVVAFWALFYVGNKYTDSGKSIAICAVIFFVVLLLHRVKTYIKKTIMNK